MESAIKTTQAQNLLLVPNRTAGSHKRSVVTTLRNPAASDERALCSMVTAITELAIVSREVLHIFADYSVHTHTFRVDVFPAGTDYNCARRPAFGASIRMGEKDALDRLKHLEDSLIDLVAAAKDDAMGAC